MMQALQVAALAFPIADGVIDEFELAQPPKIGDRKNAFENAFETSVVAFTGQQVHLQEPFV